MVVLHRFPAMFIICFIFLWAAVPRPCLSDPTVPLTLENALERTLSTHPGLSADRESVNVLAEKVQQARLRPNPEGEFRTEPRSSPSVEVMISQRIELGRKRQLRTSLARQEREVAAESLGIGVRSLSLDIIERYFDVLETQKKVALQDQSVHLAREILADVTKRIAMGAVPEVESTRARLALSQEVLVREELLGELTGRKQQLSLMWGSSVPDFEQVSEGNTAADRIPTEAEILARIDSLPEIRMQMAAIGLAKVSVMAEKSAGIADVTVGGGYFHEEEGDGVILSVAVPLPLFDRNQGNRAAAEAAVRYHEHSLQALRLKTNAELLAEVGHYRVLRDKLISLRESSLPLATEVFRQSEELYQRGKFGLLDLLNARQTLIDTESGLIETGIAVLKSYYRIETLSGPSTGPDSTGEHNHDE